MIKKLILGSDKNLQRKIVLWNMIASTLAAGQSALMLVIVTRVISLEEAGIFTLAYSIGQMMMTIGYFDMRSFQVTDIRGQVEFKHYFTSRIITCALMMFVSIFYIGIKNYTGYKAVVVFLACLFKMTDAVEDVLHALFQKSGRLDVAGKLQTIRFIVTILVFAVCLIASKNLILALVLATVVSILIILILNLPLVSEFDVLRVDFNFGKLKVLFTACLPLFIGSYLALYMENAPKYAIDQFLTETDQAYYGMLAITAFVVNLFSSFAFRPLLTPLAVHWENKRYKNYLRTIVKLLGWVLVLTVVILIGTYIAGIPVLSLLYGKDLAHLKAVLLIIITGGGINAFGTILYYTLTIMRRQNWLLAGYVATAIAAYFVAPYCVKNYQLIGAAVSFALIVSIRSIIFIGLFIAGYRRGKE